MIDLRVSDGTDAELVPQPYRVSGAACVLDRGPQVSRAGGLVGGYLEALRRSIPFYTERDPHFLAIYTFLLNTAPAHKNHR